MDERRTPETKNFTLELSPVFTLGALLGYVLIVPSPLPVTLLAWCMIAVIAVIVVGHVGLAVARRRSFGHWDYRLGWKDADHLPAYRQLREYGPGRPGRPTIHLLLAGVLILLVGSFPLWLFLFFCIVVGEDLLTDLAQWINEARDRH